MMHLCKDCSQVMVHVWMQVLRTLVKLYTHSGSPDYINICQCLMFLDDPAGVAAILDKLVKGDTVSKHLSSYNQ